MKKIIFLSPLGCLLTISSIQADEKAGHSQPATSAKHQETSHKEEESSNTSKKKNHSSAGEQIWKKKTSSSKKKSKLDSGDQNKSHAQKQLHALKQFEIAFKTSNDNNPPGPNIAVEHFMQTLREKALALKSPQSLSDHSDSKPEDSSKFYRLFQEADVFYDSKKYAKAASKYQESGAWRPLQSTAYFNAACSWALAGDKAQAMEMLNKAHEAGWDNEKKLKEDADLDSLRDLEEFKQLQEKIKASPALANMGNFKD